ncbi:Ser-Thr-rich glycosyl-phosphatidyl-inositol-anchored membrane family protein [compost metagenome]
MSLRFQLIANNESIIFVDSDNFNNTNAPVLIGQSQTVIDGAIGDANYDIGHTVSTGGGGLASAGVCTTGVKARGITGSDAPVNDAYDIDFVAHEIGHQFGASHTFNGEGGNCSLPNPAIGDPGTRVAAFAVEPGSGTTVMAYAGICDAVNVQEHSDDYFHAVSIGQMVARIAGAGNCVAGVANGNTPPVINALTSYTIPKGTAFVLKGNATDADGDALTYCWEQTNAGASAINPSATSTDSNPNFRSLSPSTSPNRYMPALPSVLSGNLATTWEVIPNVARAMSFALTVRDNRAPNGGQTARQNMTVTFNDATGPFKVTSQSVDGISWTQGQTETITWDVAGTTGAPINTANVNILLSTDNGVTFNTLLANTPNDGSQAITVPNTAAPLCRIMVEAVGNIYYAVNAKTFSIGYTLQNVCTTYTNSTVTPIPDGPDPANPVAGPTLTSTINVPDMGVITDVNVRVNVTHQWIRDLTSILKHPDGTQVDLGIRICNDQDGYNILFNDGSPAIVCAAPVTSGTFRPTGLLSTLNNKAMTGNWQLLINDYFQGDTGNLNSWSIEICRLSAVLNTPNFGLADFKIYPNPNKGNFNVQFNSESGNEIKINVHDISGRLIFNKTYQNTGLFSENLQLNNVQSGVYLVNVIDGDRKEVKKIIIE